MNAREEILASIRKNLGDPPALQGGAAPSTSQAKAAVATREERLQEFCRKLRQVGGSTEILTSTKEASAALDLLFEQSRATRLAISDSPLVQEVVRGLGSKVQLIEAQAPRSELLAAEVGFTSAQWGIAETGSLVLASDRERHRLVSLLPPIHVAILPVQQILGSLDDAMAKKTGRTTTIITGPSRTADIELTLVVGVHGPRQLHVLLLR